MMSQGIYCQKIEPYLVSSNGGYNLTGDVRMHWAVGEPAVSTHKNGLILTEGFFQTWARLVPVFEAEWDIEISFYPNPSANQITIRYDKNENIGAEVYDILGRKIMTLPEIKSEETIDISSLSTGQYLLRFFDESQNQEIHKFIKL